MYVKTSPLSEHVISLSTARSGSRLVERIGLRLVSLVAADGLQVASLSNNCAADVSPVFA